MYRIHWIRKFNKMFLPQASNVANAYEIKRINVDNANSSLVRVAFNQIHFHSKKNRFRFFFWTIILVCLISENYAKLINGDCGFRRKYWPKTSFKMRLREFNVNYSANKVLVSNFLLIYSTH